MREPIREPNPPEQRPARGPEPLRYAGPVRANEAAPYVPTGLVEWAPTWGGMFVSLGILLLLGSLGLAIGAGNGPTAAGVWGAISVIIGFFVGGWFTGRTLDMIDSLVASAHGILVWAVAMIFTLLFAGAVAVSAISRSAAVTSILAPLGLAPGTPPTAAAAATAVTSSWVTFIVLLLALAAAVGGALVGNNGRVPIPHRH